jgi:hypothetical protein
LTPASATAKKSAGECLGAGVDWGSCQSSDCHAPRLAMDSFGLGGEGWVMRCRGCGEKWSLVCGLGPGGEASPGQYLCVAVGVALLALVVAYLWDPLGGVLLGIVAGLVLLNCLGRCGCQQPATAYQGSLCPRCGRMNWIWPWNF